MGEKTSATPSSTRDSFRFGNAPVIRPSALPTTQAMSTEDSNRPKVHGRACAISSLTGVGDIASEGPKSCVSKTRRRNPAYWLARVPFRPKASESTSRNALTCSCCMDAPQHGLHRVDREQARNEEDRGDPEKNHGQITRESADQEFHACRPARQP